MDVNGTRFDLLLGKPDWEDCTAAGGAGVLAERLGSPPAMPSFAWDPRTQELTLQAEAFLFTQQAAAQGDLDIDRDRRGVDADRFGNVYWIDEGGYQIKVRSTGSGASSHFWSAGDGARCIVVADGEFEPAQSPPPAVRCRLSGLAVTGDHHLVVGTLEPAGVLFFDLYSGGPPQQLAWPSSVEFVPFDMAARSQGGVWILDRKNRRVWALDRLLSVVPHRQPSSSAAATAEFGPAGPATEAGHVRPAPRPVITLDAALPLDEANPISIDALPDDSFLILAQPPSVSPPDRNFATLSRYRLDAGLVGRKSTAALHTHLTPESTFSVVAYDMTVAIAPPPTTESTTASKSFAVTVTVATLDGNQCFDFGLQVGEDDKLELGASPTFLPMRLFGGKGLVAVGGAPYYDFGVGWIPLKEQRRPRYPDKAVLVTRLFDGREPQCVWHRLLIDAVIPPGCTIRVSSRAADKKADLVDPGSRVAWNDPEPSLYRRGTGSEIPYVEPPTRNHEGTWELLFQNLRGRYAQLKLEFTSDQLSTPRLRALRLYYPRFAYLTHYLPAAYRDDAASASFLDRFLANFEGTLTTIEDRIAKAQVLFDPDSTPRDVLPWLAEWLGVVLDPAWTEDRRRMFIRRAMDFFRWRGTATGLKMALRLALDKCADEQLFELSGNRDERRYGIRVVEGFRTRQLGGRWSPEDGEAELSRRYRETLGLADRAMRYPLLPPDPARDAEWRAFSRLMLGFVPTADDEQRRWQNFLCSAYSDVEVLPAEYGQWPTLDQIPMPRDLPPQGVRRTDWERFQAGGHGASRSLVAQWHGFLAHRYPTCEALNAAHGTGWGAFDQIAYPVELPESPALLKDWFEFEGQVLAMQRSAHRFQVLLPLFPADSGEAQREARRALAQRIVELEKPAHTVFGVEYYWALFLAGSARVGYDTLLDVGSRAPQLAAAAILNQMHLGSSHLATNFPPPGARPVLGAGALGRGAGNGGLHL